MYDDVMILRIWDYTDNDFSLIIEEEVYYSWNPLKKIDNYLFVT